MKTARAIPRSSGAPWRVQDAWTAFWQDPGQSHCAAGAPEIWRSLATHWSSFGRSLPAGARVLDLGCGAGAVARLILAARADLRLTGVDFARVPLSLQHNLDLLSETAMEQLPFAENDFGAVVSQFGFEYSSREQATHEMARVTAPGARLSLLVHHADSAIVASNRIRRGVLAGFLTTAMRTAFCAGDASAFALQMSALVARHDGDALVAELARSLPARLARAPRERLAIWKALEEAFAPEQCLADSLQECCVGPARIEAWLAPLRLGFDLEPIAVLREAEGAPIAWRIDGVRRPPGA